MKQPIHSTEIQRTRRCKINSIEQKRWSAYATAVLASGDRREITMSRVVEDFRLRFGGVPLPQDDPLASVELSGPPGGTQVIELWRPPLRVPAARNG